MYCPDVTELRPLLRVVGHDELLREREREAERQREAERVRERREREAEFIVA